MMSPSAFASVGWTVAAGAARRAPLVGAGLAMLATFMLVALFADLIAPFDPNAQDIVARLRAPDTEHWLGTDSYGRDILSRIIVGSRISLLIGAFSVLFAVLVGGSLGLLAGYRRGWLDDVLGRMMDVLLSFPTLIMGLLIVAVLGASVTNLILAIGFTFTPKFFRLARAPTLALRSREFVLSCRALGYSDARIILRHILPNMIGELLVFASLWTATAIRTEASLAFIGLGVAPPSPTWGGMIREGFENILDAPWLAIYPGIAILLVVLALNLIGDGLRDLVDPRLRAE